MIIKKLQQLVFVSIYSLIVFFAFSIPVRAEVAQGCSNSFFGLPTWYEYLDVQKVDGVCQVITDGTANVAILILLAVINILTYLSAIAAVIFIVYGGFMFVTSQGDPAKIVSARKTILNSVVGLIIALLAAQLVKFVAGFLSK